MASTARPSPDIRSVLDQSCQKFLQRGADRRRVLAEALSAIAPADLQLADAHDQSMYSLRWLRRERLA
jgi:hypothetical protein